jgi:hypothetical protein
VHDEALAGMKPIADITTIDAVLKGL